MGKKLKVKSKSAERKLRRAAQRLEAWNRLERELIPARLLAEEERAAQHLRSISQPAAQFAGLPTA